MAKIKTYRPIQGDTWESVSYKLYGSSEHVYELIKLNPEMRMIEYFDGSERINYRKIFGSSSTSSSLPPWREA